MPTDPLRLDLEIFFGELTPPQNLVFVGNFQSQNLFRVMPGFKSIVNNCVK